MDESMSDPYTQDDTNILVRETPRDKVREHLAYIRSYVHCKVVAQHIAAIHHDEHFDETLAPAEPKKKWPLLNAVTGWREKFALWLCEGFHYVGEYMQGDSHYTCSCGRKFALPWARYEDLPKGCYYNDATLLSNEPTKQYDGVGTHAKMIESCEGQ